MWATRVARRQPLLRFTKAIPDLPIQVPLVMPEETNEKH